MANVNETAGEVYFKHIHSLNSSCNGSHTITVFFQFLNAEQHIIININQYNSILFSSR